MKFTSLMITLIVLNSSTLAMETTKEDPISINPTGSSQTTVLPGPSSSEAGEISAKSQLPHVVESDIPAILSMIYPPDPRELDTAVQMLQQELRMSDNEYKAKLAMNLG